MQVTIISPNVMTFKKKVFLQKYKIFRKGYRFLNIELLKSSTNFFLQFQSYPKIDDK